MYYCLNVMKLWIDSINSSPFFRIMTLFILLKRAKLLSILKWRRILTVTICWIIIFFYKLLSDMLVNSKYSGRPIS